jgi:hypothetical protein
MHIHFNLHIDMKQIFRILAEWIIPIAVSLLTTQLGAPELKSVVLIYNQ